ncbi:MAG TPA: hypothetical protein PK711_01830 [Bacteroidales bacterium]|nr:hypothetical protein [Bacteroidales bacterium]HRZ20504.1 hypothetical protein [Bacteroidales bacterium]
MIKMNKILLGHKFVGNFLDEPVAIGKIYKMDDRQFLPALQFSDVYPAIDLAKWTDSGSPGDLKFNVTSDVGFKFGGGASSSIGESKVEIEFLKRRKVAGYLRDATVQSLRYENIRGELKKLWQDKGYTKFLRDYIFIFEVVTAASGTLVYSSEGGTKVVLEHTLAGKVTKLADLGSGNFQLTANSERTLEIIRNTSHIPLFKAFRFRKNWEPEILG